MKQPKFVPLDISLIDEGRFVAAAAEEFAAAQDALYKFKKKYGEGAQGAKAKIKIEVVLSIDSVDESDADFDLFGISASVKKDLPARPKIVSKAIAGETDKGEGALFVRQTGSSAHTPAQTKLCTNNGRVIDQDTGDVSNPTVDDARD